MPQEAYYGVETIRAQENFPISGLKAHLQLIRATVYVKKAAALTNMALGQLPPAIGQAIVKAADEVLAGRWHEQFVVDVFQAGAGVSHNMNTNEVLANRAIEILGGQKGDYSLVHPHDHVNRAQSTNDVFPTATRVAALFLVGELVLVLGQLEKAFREKAGEFRDVVKSGRTHMQDAVPITLGQEFGAYATTIGRNRGHIERASLALTEVNLGATAVGTGLNAHPDYARLVVEKLAELTGLPLGNAEDVVQSTQNPHAFAELSGALKLLTSDLIKIANDLILMSSGPRTGLAEIRLPALQPGSSIMPGKVNLVMPEMLNMVCLQVIGNDLSISVATQAGQLDLNVYMPTMSYNLLQSLEILKNALRVFSERCVLGIVADKERCYSYYEESLGLATVLSPYLGYEVAASVTREALDRGKGLRDLILEKGLLPKDKLDALLPPRQPTPSRRRSKRQTQS